MVNTSLIKPDELLEGYRTDKNWSNILKLLENPEINDSKTNALIKNYYLKDNCIYLKKDNRLVIPRMKNIIIQILQENYNIPISGHLGQNKTYE